VKASSSLFWGATAAALVIELAAVALMLRPDVDPVYRAYYIDKSSDCWPHRTDAAYVLGTPLSFAYPPKGADFTPNKICGWFYPDARGDWSYGRYSLLRFNFTPTAASLTLTLTAGAMVDSAHPAQEVRVAANGTALGSLTFDSFAPETRTLAIPATIAASGRIELRFDYPDARPGNELGLLEDPHLRAIKVETLTLAPAS
jgi:hypothetical protein